MHQKLKARLDDSFRLTSDLVNHLDESALGRDLPGLPSNPIAGQLWCVIGARESYTRAIVAGVWQGFSCSLATPRDRQSVLDLLSATHEQLRAIDFNGLCEARIDLALALLEHEAQHHGQLIRYVYGNGLTFPASWSKRYTV